MVAGLQGLQQPEEQVNAWQRAWDEVNDLHLEGEEAHADADMTAQRKRPDTLKVSWGKQRLLIFEFTRPNDRCELSLHNTDLYKAAWYKSLLDLLARLLLGWEVELQTYTVGILDSHDPLESCSLQNVCICSAKSRQIQNKCA